jgi:hypothetical protein
MLLAAAQAAAPEAEYVQAVEFPYYLYPRALWERELVWMKTIGVRTVEFSIPWNWHEPRTAEFDFTGRTSPRRDLAALLRILRRLELRAWVRPMPPVGGWLNNGWPAGAADAQSQRAWLKELGGFLGPQTVKHGGPVAYVEGRELPLEVAQPPAPITVLSARDSNVLMRSREAVGSVRGSLLWTDVESSVYPEGWESPGAMLLRPGAVELSGDEISTAGLRREAGLLRNWASALGMLRPVTLPRPLTGKLPEGVTATELISPKISAVSISNRAKSAFHDDLRVRDSLTRHVGAIPGVTVPGGESLWLPLNVALGPGGLCRECTNFSSEERIVYATAELVTVEFENGILAMEFAAPVAGEVVLQLVREPVGPYLAAGKPTKFDWDEKTLRARLPIPAGAGAANRVRIGLAIEEPDTSAFFGETRRLIIGEKNVISTVYSSPEVAARSRLRLPEGFTATPEMKSPNEIEYTVSVPTDALHGDFATLALEADGMLLGRARLQLFRPASIRLNRAIELHFGPRSRVAADPAIVPVETRGGGNVEIVIRNNSPEIRSYHLTPSGNDLEFTPAQLDVSIGALEERTVSFRMFGKDEGTGLREWHLRVSGGMTADIPFRAVLLPRMGTVAWSADLDGDGTPEWVLESQKARAVFSAADSGRWIEFVWKDTNTNFVPLEGAFAQAGAVQVHMEGDRLDFAGTNWHRTVKLHDVVLEVEQSAPLPAELLPVQSASNVQLLVDRSSSNTARFELRQSPSEINSR